MSFIPLAGAGLDSYLAIAQGNIPGVTHVNKFGRNPDIDAGVAEDLWSEGGTYVYMTTAKVLDVFSSDANDVGNVDYNSTATDGSDTTLEDTLQDFTDTNVVAVGDILLNDTTGEWSYISVVTPTILTVDRMKVPNAAGHSYRIIDMSDGGTGAHAIQVFGLDADYNEINEFVILNGVTDVETTKVFFRVWRAYVICAGATGSAAGIIKGEEDGTANVVFSVALNRAQTGMSHYTIPAGKSGYIVNWFMQAGKSGAVATIDCQLVIRNRGGVFRRLDHVGLNTTGTSGLELTFHPPIPIREKTDMKVIVLSDQNNTEVHGGYDLVLIND